MGRLAALPWVVSLPLVLAVSCIGDERRDQPQAGEPLGNPPPSHPSGDPPPVEPIASVERALSGGTIAVSPDQQTAVVSDPARGRVVLLDLSTEEVREIPLELGDEPGRAAFDDEGRVHVVLRGAGALLTVDLEDATSRIVGVCAAPRGIAFDPTTKLLHVVGVLGDLQTVDPETGLVLRSVMLEPDLRDVVVRGDRLFVTTFRSATLLTVNAAGEIEGRTPAPAPDGFRANVAWKMAPFEGGVVVVHQASTNREIDVEPEPDAPPAYVGVPETPCDVLVSTSVTIYEEQPDGALVVRSGSVGALTLPVDVAVSPDATELSVAASGIESIGRAPMAAVGSGAVPCAAAPGVEVTPTGDVVGAVYFEGGLLVQMRQPDVVRVVSKSGSHRDVELGGADVEAAPSGNTVGLTQGYRLFHRGKAGPRTVTCASCHPEGRDDGHVWQFSTLGARRTQSLIGGISDTAPFHWSGDMADLSTLMEEVFEHRMGQIAVTPEEVEALGAWLDAQPALPSGPGRSDDSDGRKAFEKAGCDTCHAGDTFRTSGSFDVGTGGEFQVPSLLGVAARAPYMHDGCAPTLEARLDDPACGGDDHGEAHVLQPTERAQLLAYLRSL